MPQMLDKQSTNETAPANLLLWVDRVGAALLCRRERMSIGGPAFEEQHADLSLFANLSRRHAAIVRDGEAYYLEAHATVRVASRPVTDRAYLADGNLIELGEDVQLRFRLPSALSTSARLEFVSDHRPALSVDSVVMMADTCLMGPGVENHVVCPHWPASVILIQHAGKLHCKSRTPLLVGHMPVDGMHPVAAGDVVMGEEIRFRVEAVQDGTESN